MLLVVGLLFLLTILFSVVFLVLPAAFKCDVLLIDDDGAGTIIVGVRSFPRFDLTPVEAEVSDAKNRGSA
jgi:hypothetical protein